MPATPLSRRVIVDPAHPFDTIAAWIEGAGWVRTGGATLPPLLPGETEAATWAWPRTAAPRLTYSFNPVLGLRSLDLTWVPTSWRLALARGLPLLDVAALERRLLGSRRERLHAIAALAEVEAVGSMPRLVALRGDESVRPPLEHALDTLGRIAVAKELAAAALQPLATSVADALPGALRPELDLLPGLLAAELVDAATAHYASGATPPRAVGAPVVEPVPAFALRSPNAWSNLLSPAWGLVAPWLLDGPTWCGVRFGGTRLDGVVAYGGAVAWFPRLPMFLAGELERRGIPLTTGVSFS